MSSVKPKKFVSNPKAVYDKVGQKLTIWLKKEHTNALVRDGKVQYASLTPREVMKVDIIMER